ncbi:MAG: DUF692 family protein [Gammaproteobacteria bacterium]|nr:DUF692 family protein [Gammaproteobacteria bacterium]
MRASAKTPDAAPDTGIGGVGIGLRSPHVERILAGGLGIRWLEILADNYLAQGGRCRRDLERLRANHPCTFHCVGMSIGSGDALNLEYLDAIKALADRYQPAWVSDHLCFVSAQGEYQNDLLPLPYTEEAVRHAADRIARIQERLGRRILIENVSCYLDFRHSTMSEAEFVNAVCERADCFLLLDINNLYVNQVNLGTPAQEFLDAVDIGRIREIHLAGFEQKEGFVIDAHNHPVSENVWQLYESFIAANPRIPTLIEWDFDIPGLDRLLEEARKAEVRYPQQAREAPSGANPGATAGRKAKPRAKPQAFGAAGPEMAPARRQRRDGNPPSVKALQERFLRALKHDDSALRPHIRTLPQLPPPTQISIYRNNADNTRIQALEQCYPVCVRILGGRYFRQLAKAFIRAHPSRHPDLNRYGAEMSTFISELAQAREELQDFAYLPDLARLEYLHHRCYYREDDARTDYALLKESCGERERQPRLSLNHTVALLSSDFPVYEIWRAHQHAKPPAEFEQPPQPQRICVYREKTTPRIEKITDGDYLILQEATRAPALDELIEELSGDPHFADRPIDQAIPKLVAKGWLLVEV